MRGTGAVLALLLGVVLVAGCSGTGGLGPASAAGEVGSAKAVLPAARVVTQPADKVADVNPGAPAMVTATGGRLDQVSLTNADGKPVAGALSPDGRIWNSTEALGYGKIYTWRGSATGADGAQVPVGGSFSTVKPARQIRGTFNIADGASVGIAAPIILQFDGHVTDKAAVERALSVTTSVPTTGSWAWLSDDNGGSRAHWRPKEYFQPGTEVSVTASLYGLSYGNGVFGKEDLSTHFTVGRSQVVKANVNSHRLVVVRDGKVVMDIPASYGLGSDPNRNTRNGVHVVMSKEADKFMSNPRYGYVNVHEKWAVRISNNGEFIHANPATTGVQGERNVTHGCVNLSTANAKAYFDTVLFGDPVEVTNSPIPLSGADGDIYDWAISWDKWQSMSALV